MLIVLIAWLYVALMAALAEAMHPAGHWWGAVMTFLLYGLGPVSLVLYLLGTPRRRKARATAEAQARAEAEATSAGQSHDGREPAGGAVAPERKEA